MFVVLEMDEENYADDDVAANDDNDRQHILIKTLFEAFATES